MNVYFSFYFFPLLLVTYGLYWFVLKSDLQRTAAIAVFSAGVLAWFHPVYSVIVFLVVVAVYCLLRLKQQGRVESRLISLFTFCVALIIMLVGKYAASIGKALFPADDPFLAYFVMPLGVSYFFFRIVQYAFDHHRGLIPEVSLLRLYAFVTFLPLLPAGPVETYQGFYGKRTDIRDGRMHLEGIRRLLLGFFKKLFIVDMVLELLRGQWSWLLSEELHGSVAVYASSTLYAFFTYARVYFDMAAYADIAIGCSLLFGFVISEDVNRPYLCSNLSDFWQRWHMTVSGWCRNNIFFPIFGATRKVWLGLMCSMLFMGMWHALNLNWLGWAILHGSVLCGIYFLGVYKKRHPAFKKLAKHKVYIFSSWLFTQLFVAAVNLVSMPVPFERSLELFGYSLPGMVCLYAGGLAIFCLILVTASWLRKGVPALTGRISVRIDWAVGLVKRAFAREKVSYGPMLLGLATTLVLLGAGGYCISSGLYTAIPEKYLIKKPYDIQTHFSYLVHSLQRMDKATLGTPVYFIDGSSMQAAIVPAWIERNLEKQGFGTARIFNLGISRSSYRFERDVVDHLPEYPSGIVVVGITQFKFSYPPEKAYPYSFIPIWISQRQGLSNIQEWFWYAVPFRGVCNHIKRYVVDNCKVLATLALPEHEEDLFPQVFWTLEQREQVFFHRKEEALRNYPHNNQHQLQELQSLFTYIRDKGHFPVAMILPMAHDFINGRLDAVDGYVQVTKDLCTQMNIPLLDYYNVPGLSRYFFDDSMHLSEAGRVVFTPLVSQGLTSILTGYFKQKKPE